MFVCCVCLWCVQVMESIDKILAALGAMDVDAKLESQLVDGALYAFQEQTTEDTRTMLNGFGVIINSLGQRAKLYLPQMSEKNTI